MFSWISSTYYFMLTLRDDAWHVIKKALGNWAYPGKR